MSKTESKTDRKPDCKECSYWEAIREHVRVTELLDKAIVSYDEKLKDKDFKPTIAEYLKLLQLEKELEDEIQDTEVHVTWVGPETASQEEK
jgi:hypothetical protein